MNTFKKIMASVLAITSVASVAGVMANAEETNAVSVSYETLTSAITADDGTVIPAGAVAVEVAINNNTGFKASSLTFNMSSADALTNESGAPVIDNGAVLDDAMVAAAQNNGKLVVSYSAADTMSSDGELFTFYMSEASDVTFAETVTAQPSNETSVYAYRKYWIIGDVDGDLIIELDDCTAVQDAVAKTGGRMVEVNDVNADLAFFFPNSPMPFAECVDGNIDDWIMDSNVNESDSDARQILNYYSITAAGLTYDVEGWHIGEKLYYYV